MNKVSYKIATELSKVWKLQSENCRICIYAVNINTVYIYTVGLGLKD